MLVSGRFRSIQAAAALASILIGGIARTLAEEVVPFSCKAKSVTSLSAELDSPSAQPAFPIPKGQIDKAIQGLDGIVGEALNRSGVPGLAIAVVHDDEVVYEKGFGVRRVGTGEPVDENTVFQLASVSKPLGSTVIAGVIGQGSGLDWNTPVAKHLTGFALADPYVSSQVSIGDLYSHRSGLPDHAGDLLEDLGYDRDEILRRLRFQPLAPFRATYAYTNFGLTAAAQAVANATGMSWEDLSRKVLYKPLGMTSTSSRFADYDQAPNKAVLHVRVGDHWEAKYTRQPDAQSPAGGVSSSISDMAQWLRLQLANGKLNGRQVIAEEVLIQTRCPFIMSSPPDTSLSRAAFCGLGMGVGYDPAGRVRFSHSGGFDLGAATAVVLLPSESLGVVVLTNGMPIGVPEAVASGFLDLVEFGAVQRDWLPGYGKLFAAMRQNPSTLAGKTPPAKPVPAQPSDAYVGRYENPYYGPLDVFEDNGGLVMELGPKHLSFLLHPWDGDTFAYDPIGESALGISAVTFGMDGDRAVGVTLENLDEDGLGTFTR